MKKRIKYADTDTAAIDEADWMEEYVADINDEVTQIRFDIGGDCSYNLTHEWETY